MPRKRSKQKRFNSDLVAVTEIPKLNNNISSYITEDEIHQEKLTPLSDKVIPHVKKKVQLKSNTEFRKFRYFGSKFERNHDTRSLDKFFFRKGSRKRNKRKFSRKVTFIKEDEEISFMMKEEELLERKQVKDIVNDFDCGDIKEKSDRKEESDLEEIVDLDEFFPYDVVDLELEDFDTKLSNERLDDLIEIFSLKPNEDHEEEIVSKDEKEDILVNDEHYDEKEDILVNEEHYKETLDLAFDLLEVFFQQSESEDHEVFLRELMGVSSEEIPPLADCKTESSSSPSECEGPGRETGLNVPPGL